MFARRGEGIHRRKADLFASCTLRSGVYRLPDNERLDTAASTAQAAYEEAGIGPHDLEAIELHDAMAPAELMLYERLGLCAPGDGPKLIDDGVTTLRAACRSIRAAVFVRADIRSARRGFCKSPSLSGRCAGEAGGTANRKTAEGHHGAEPGRAAARTRLGRLLLHDFET